MRGGRLALGFVVATAAAVVVAFCCVVPSGDARRLDDGQIPTPVERPDESAAAPGQTPGDGVAPAAVHRRVPARAPSAVGREEGDGEARSYATNLVRDLLADGGSFREERERTLKLLPGLPPEEVVPVVLDALESGEELRYESYAIRALEAVGPKAGPWAARIVALHLDGSGGRRASMIAGLGRAAWPFVETELASQDDASRRGAAETVARMADTVGAPAIDRLIALTSDDDPEIRGIALVALGDVEAPTERVLRALLTAFVSRDRSRVSAARNALARQAGAAAPLRDAIVAAFIRGEVGARDAAAVLVETTDRGERAARLLMDSIPPGDEFWAEGVDGLRLGVDALATLAAGPAVAHRRAAAEAVEARVCRGDDWSASRAPLLTALADPDAAVRLAALGRTRSGWGPGLRPWRGTIPSEVVSSVMALTHDHQRAVRRAALERLLATPVDPGVLAAAFLSALRSQDVADRIVVLDMIRSRAVEPETLAPAVAACVASADPGERSVALEALRALRPGTRAAIETVLAALDDPVPDVRAAAAGALIVLDPPGEAARSTLEGLFARRSRDWDWLVVATSLDTVRGGTWVPLLLDQVVNDPDVDWFHSALRGRPGVAAGIRRRIDQGASPAARLAMIDCVDGDDPESRALLTDVASHDDDTSVRAAAARLLLWEGR